MKQIELTGNKMNRKMIAGLSAMLDNGSVMAYPTDTVYGLGCDATRTKAVLRVYKIKKRNKKKQAILLVSSIAMAKKYCHIDKEQEKLLKAIWPAPVSVVLNSRLKLPKILESPQGAAALRLPDNKFLKLLIKKLGKPIVSTSLNIEGRATLKRPVDLEKYFDQLPDIAIDAGVSRKAKPSALIDIRNMDNIKILRP